MPSACSHLIVNHGDHHETESQHEASCGRRMSVASLFGYATWASSAPGAIAATAPAVASAAGPQAAAPAELPSFTSIVQQHGRVVNISVTSGSRRRH
jgi:hypothetical protein